MNRLKDLIQICPSKGKTNEMTITRNALITRVSMIGAMLTLTACLAAPLSADNFFFETGSPNPQQPVLGALSRRPSPGNIETETADDFVLQATTVIKSATITGLLPTGTPVGSI